LLAEAGPVVIVGTTRGGQPAAADWPADGCVQLRTGDLREPGFVEALIADVAPDWVVHLAAQASVAASWRDPAATLVNNAVAQANLLESVVRRVPHARVLVFGSSEEYGRLRPEDLPASEEAPLRPESPYAVSKVTQDFLGLQYHLARQLAVVRVRPFNLFGPGQSDQFALASFARQIAEAEQGLRPPVIAGGNLSARRDYTDVRDAVRAYRALLLGGQSGEVYNVGGGGVRSIGEILEALRGLAWVRVDVTVDPARLRPVETAVVAVNAGRIREAVGWAPTIPFEQTVADILDDWRRRVARAEHR
jgi:GDP-4-dehydro-6-deoxy-D-mannose reductase